MTMEEKLAFEQARLRRLQARSKENDGVCRKIRRNIRHLLARP